MKIAPINKIIPFSNVDGPGNRTSIFFQGCSFACQFCHNPETIHLCTHCGACVQKCPTGALTFQENHVNWRDDLCVQCDTCINVCPYSASPRVKWMSVEDVVQQVQRTLPYIEGITTSGGDCTLYADFLIDLFSAVKSLGKTCLIDGNGAFNFSADPRILSFCDGVMLDVKAVDPAWSKRLISNDGRMVLKNLDDLLSRGKLTEVRTVILPGRDLENEETVSYVARRIQSACPYKLIRYRPFGVLEEFQRLLGEETTDPDYAEHFASLARDLGATHAYVI